MPRDSTTRPLAERVRRILNWTAARVASEATSPEVAELVNWVNGGHCPPEAMALTGHLIVGTILPESLPDTPGLQGKVSCLDHLHEMEDGDLQLINSIAWETTNQEGAELRIAIKLNATLTQVTDSWNNLPEADREVGQQEFPLVPLMKAWVNRPRPAPTSSRATERIIPAKVAMAPPGDRREGKLFSMAAHVERGPDGHQLVMPGFQVNRQAPALPLALYDLGLGALEHRARNPAAPLALRLWVASILGTRQQDRHGNHPVALEIPLRQLLAELYPGRKPRPNEYWPRLMKAVETLGNPEARVPWYDHELGRGGQRHVVLVGDIPRGPGALDDHVQLIVNLPPSSENGPKVSNNLALWGVKSDRAYRALLNLAYWWHDPGVTQRPLGQRVDGQGRFWGQSQNPGHYPEMTDEQLVQIVFPTSAKKQFRNLVHDAHQVFLQLQRAGEIDVIDGKPVPPRKLPIHTTEQRR